MGRDLLMSCVFARDGFSAGSGRMPLVWVFAAVMLFGCSGEVNSSASSMQAEAPPATAQTDPVATGDEIASGGFTGRCLCGAVRYRAEGEIRNCNYCDCKGCRKVSGADRVGWVVVPRGSLRVTGETKRVRGDAKEYPRCDAHGVRMFCPHCGTHLFWQGDRGDTVDIAAGTLDDSSIFQPKPSP